MLPEKRFTIDDDLTRSYWQQIFESEGKLDVILHRKMKYNHRLLYNHFMEMSLSLPHLEDKLIYANTGIITYGLFMEALVEQHRTGLPVIQIDTITRYHTSMVGELHEQIHNFYEELVKGDPQIARPDDQELWSMATYEFYRGAITPSQWEWFKEELIPRAPVFVDRMLNDSWQFFTIFGDKIGAQKTDILIRGVADIGMILMNKIEHGKRNA